MTVSLPHSHSTKEILERISAMEIWKTHSFVLNLKCSRNCPMNWGMTSWRTGGSPHDIMHDVMGTIRSHIRAFRSDCATYYRP